MTSPNVARRFAGLRLSSSRRWVLTAIAGLRRRLATKPGQPLFDNAVIAAACECPRLTVELLVAPRAGAAAAGAGSNVDPAAQMLIRPPDPRR